MSLASPIIAVLADFQPLVTAPAGKKVVTLLIGMVISMKSEQSRLRMSIGPSWPGPAAPHLG
jgi:hypothetical protein